MAEQREPRPDASPTVAAPENAYYTSTGGALREVADALAEAALAMDRAARGLRRLAYIDAGIAPTPSAAPPLRGAELRQAIVQVARERIDPAEPFYYRDLFALVERAGHLVGGKDPLASFLTALSRTPGFEQVGGRSGLYRLTEEVTPAS